VARPADGGAGPIHADGRLVRRPSRGAGGPLRAGRRLTGRRRPLPRSRTRARRARRLDHRRSSAAHRGRARRRGGGQEPRCPGRSSRARGRPRARRAGRRGLWRGGSCHAPRRHSGGGHRGPALLSALGFRMLRVERDAFTPAAGYPPIEIDGIPLRDRVWLSLTLDPGARRGRAGRRRRSRAGRRSG